MRLRFARLRIRARCDLLSNSGGVGRCMTHIGRLNVSDTTVASRKIVCNIVSFCHTTETRKVGPVLKYRMCMTPNSEFSHRTKDNRSECCRLILLTRGGRNCTGLVGVISGNFARKFCCGPQMSLTMLGRCRRKVVTLDTYLTNRITECLRENVCRSTGTTTLHCRSVFKGNGFFLRLRSRKVPTRELMGRRLLHVRRRAKVSLITAGSIRCAETRSTSPRSVLLYLRAGGGLTSRSEVHCRNNRCCIGSPRRVTRLFPCTLRTLRGARGVTREYRIRVRFNIAGLPEFSIPSNLAS